MGGHDELQLGMAKITKDVFAPVAFVAGRVGGTLRGLQSFSFTFCCLIAISTQFRVNKKLNLNQICSKTRIF